MIYATPFEFALTSTAILLAVGYYWGQDQYPLAAVKVPVVKWLWGRGPTTVEGYPEEEGRTFLQVVGFGTDCGVCVGQWAGFGLSWVLFVSPVTDFWWWLVLAVALNAPNFVVSKVAGRFELFD